MYVLTLIAAIILGWVVAAILVRIIDSAPLAEQSSFPYLADGYLFGAAAQLLAPVACSAYVFLNPESGFIISMFLSLMCAFQGTMFAFMVCLVLSLIGKHNKVGDMIESLGYSVRWFYELPDTALVALLRLTITQMIRGNDPCHFEVTCAQLQTLGLSPTGGDPNDFHCSPDLLLALENTYLTHDEAREVAQELLSHASLLCTDHATTKGNGQTLNLFQVGQTQLTEVPAPGIDALPPAERLVYAALEKAGMSPTISWHWGPNPATDGGCHWLSVSW